MEAKRTRRRLERRWLINKTAENKLAYRKSCKVANKLIMDSLRVKHSNDIEAASDNSRTLWKAVNKLLHPPSSSQSINGSTEFCAAVGNFFINKINKIRATRAAKIAGISNFCSNDPKHEDDVLDSLQTVAPEEVSSVISKMALKFSPTDVIPASLIKLFPDIFGQNIARLANLFFEQGIFPSSYKKAQITPLLKKHNLDPKEPANYRPISNLSTISKILEKLVLAKIKPFICASESFCKVQSAYRERHSTETALLKIFDDIYRNVDNQLGTVLVTLDISAAFDCVRHDILLRRLEFTFGVTGRVLTWFQSYLSGRSQFVKIQDVVSDTCGLETGVPQGSCLGPFLFCVYVSTLASVIPDGVCFHQYADDVQLYCGIKASQFQDDVRILEQCTTAIERWFLFNGMLLNADKSESVVLSTAVQAHRLPSDLVVMVAGCSIKPATSLRSLGVTLDSLLRFDSHITEVSRS